MKTQLFFFLILLIISCEKKQPETTVAETKIEQKTIVQSKTDSLKAVNEEILQVLKSGDYKEFSKFIHPEKGVRFSMYAFVEPTSDKNFSKKDFEKYVDSNVKFTWGKTDGEGKPLVLSINEYLKKWVFEKDYSKGKFTANKFQGSGNSLNNLTKIYPEKDFTENFVEGTEKYSGMDWGALRFVFEKLNGKYYLIAVVNDKWTI